MVAYYLDSSALLKNYVQEIGSPWLNQLLIPSQTICFTAEIAMIEVVSAFNRRVREGTVTITEYQHYREIFKQDCHDLYELISLDTEIIHLSWQLLERYALRSYDVAHLATAIILNQRFLQLGEPALTFLSADNRLNLAAQAEGLAVDNPNQHP